MGLNSHQPDTREPVKLETILADTFGDFKSGNPRTWEVVQRQVLPKVRKALQSRFGAEQYAYSPDDAIESAVGKFWAKVKSGQYGPQTLGELESWLVVVAGSKLRDQRKSAYNKRRQSLHGDNDDGWFDRFPGSEPTPLEELLATEAIEEVVRALPAMKLCNP